MSEPHLPSGYGQVAYEGWVAHVRVTSAEAGSPPPPMDSWADLRPAIRGNWDAAAQAVADYLRRVPS